MNINSLLNPAPEQEVSSQRQRRRSNRRLGRNNIAGSLPRMPAARRQRTKDAKDAPKFEKGDPSGGVNYPPYVDVDEESQRQQKRFAIFPSSKIEEYPRHIPYNSEKKGFSSKTGRDAFEVFQYTFRYDKDIKDRDEQRSFDKCNEWTVMWDYNVGLVRITPFFKAQGLAKTVPAKAINQNPGLKELCHSITGGALAAQGYWMPFDAAKALAATFCWKIRYALTPIFGPDFLKTCTQPDDPIFNRHTIDPKITERCAMEVKSWKSGSKPRRRVSHAKVRVTPSPSVSPEPEGPSNRPLRPRPTRRYTINDSSGSESGSDGNSGPESSPLSSPEPHQSDEPGMRRGIGNHTSGAGDRQGTPQAMTLRDAPRFAPSLYSTPEPSSSTVESPTTRRTYSDMNDDEDVDTRPSSSSGPPSLRTKKRKVGVFASDEAKAAYQLLQLRFAT